MTYCYNMIGNRFPLHEPPLEPPEDEVIDHAGCGCEISRGERIFEWEGKMICIDCWMEKVKLLLEKNPEQLALEMGLEVELYL